MLKSLIAALLFGVTVTGFAGLAQADYRQCATPIIRGQCPIWLPQHRNPVRNYRIHKDNKAQDRPVTKPRA